MLNQSSTDLRPLLVRCLFESMTNSLRTPDSYGTPLDRERFQLQFLHFCYRNDLPLPTQQWMELELGEFHEALIRYAKEQGQRPPTDLLLTRDAIDLCFTFLSTYQLLAPFH